MQLDLQRTIVAVSSGVAPARRAIVRLSGSQTPSILDRLVRASNAIDVENKHRLLNTPMATSAVLPCAVGWLSRTIQARIYFWPNQRSFTGETCAEIHLLGSLPLVEAVVEQLISLGAELANRGEFTLRSFMAGKIDLAQAEAVLGVIEAEEADQLNWALGQLAGNLSQPVRVLRNQLIELLAHLEAGLDFAEEDIEFITDDALSHDLGAIRDQLTALSSQLETRGTRSRRSQVVLLGLPNAGKSSLFNALLGRERAIVTPQAGTTRDAIVDSMQIEDSVIELVDTAGIEELTEDSPRALAQSTLQERLKQADAVLFCIDLSSLPDADWFATQQVGLRSLGIPVLVVGTKLDLAPKVSIVDASDVAPACDVKLSCRAHRDIEWLQQRIRTLLATAAKEQHSSAMHRTMVRCRAAIELATAAIERALELLEVAAGEELVATEMRCALDDLSTVIGEVHSDDILGEIFSRFCIGK
jgi:tRNA modification GTPase